MKKILSKRDDVVFYLKMFPLPIHKESYAKSKAMMCAREKDNAKALKLLEDAYAKKKVPAPSCETTAVDKSISDGKSIGVRSTPTMVFQNGRLVAGAIDENAMNKLLNEKK